MDLLRLTDAWNNNDDQINFMGKTIQIRTKGRFHNISEPRVFDTTAWDVESATSVTVEHSKDSMAASKSEAVKKLISKLQLKGVTKETPLIDQPPLNGIDETPPQPPAEIPPPGPPPQHVPLPAIPPLGPPRPPSSVCSAAISGSAHAQHQSNDHASPLTGFREDNPTVFPEVFAMSSTQPLQSGMDRPPALIEPNNNRVEMPTEQPKFDNNNCIEDVKDTMRISNDIHSRPISKHKELSSKSWYYILGSASVSVALTCLIGLFIFMIIVFADLMNSYLPKTHYKGRTIHFTTKGRIHSFSESWVYDATAWDVESGTSVKVRHFEESEDAAKAAFEKLIVELKQKGIIKEDTSGNESSRKTTQPEQPQQLEQPPSHGDNKDPSEGSDGREEAMEVTGRTWVQQLKDLNEQLEIYLGIRKEAVEVTERTWVELFFDCLWYLNERNWPQIYEENPRLIYGMVVMAGIGVVVTGVVKLILHCKSYTIRFVEKEKLNSPDKYRVDGPKTIGPLFDLDDYMAVEPDGEGSYTSVHVKSARPTPQQLNANENYNMWSPVKGLAYILNNRYFPEREEKLQHRNGSEVDFTNMKHLFKELGYRIIPHENLESKDIRESIKKFVRLFNDDEADFSSAVVVLMSHGDTGYIRGTDERDVYLKQIQAEFEGNKCPKLQGKPKLFFMQACRGNLITTTSSLATDIACDSAIPPPPCTETPEVDVATDDNFAKNVPDNADMHFAYATTEGYLSLRNKVVGSWFIQVITEVFLAHAHEESLDKLMNTVTNRVSGLKGKLFDPQTKKKVTAKQTPERVTRMRKTMYFLPKYPPTY